MKKIFTLLMFLYITCNVFAQDISYKITEVKVNGNPIAFNAPIEFGTNSSVTVRFKVTFTKLDYLVIGSVSHVIGIQSPSGFIQLITPEPFSLNSGNTGFTGLWEKVIYASDYSASGENYLVSKLTQTSGTPPLNWESNRVPIIKEPTFTLSPTTVSLACDSTSPRTFTVTPANIPSGATVTYQWSYSGWNGPNSSSSSISIYPSSGTSLPSTVSVTPYINGVAKPGMSCSVSRAAFSSIAAITGTTGICFGTANYSISNIAAGQTVAWSLSNTSIGTITNQSNAGATITFSGNGAQTLSALITNTCGQTTTKTLVINTGSPTFTSTATLTGNITSICSGSRTYTLNNLLAGQTVNWSVSDDNIAALSGSSNTQTTVNFIGNGSLSLSAVIINSCGQRSTKTLQIYSGFATLNEFACGTSGRDFCSGSPIEIESNTLPILTLNDRITASFSGLTTAEAQVPANWEWQALNAKVSISGSSNSRRIMLVDYGMTGVKVRVKSACGWSPWVTLNFEIVEIPPIWNKQANTKQDNQYTIYPNPSKDIVNIELNNTDTHKQAKTSGELFDIFGISKSKVEIKDGKAMFSVKGLQKGIYILKIFINEKVESHKIAVE